MNIEIRPLKDTDIMYLTSLADTVFGHGYCDPDYFQMFDDETLVAWDADNPSYPLGFLLHKSLRNDVISELNEHGITLSSTFMDHHNNRKSREIKTIAVWPQWQHRGIGTALLSQTLNDLEKRGKKALLAPGWQYTIGQNDYAHVAKLMTGAGFFKNGVLRDLWKACCDAGEFRCLVRERTKPCICSAVIYSKTI